MAFKQQMAKSAEIFPSIRLQIKGLREVVHVAEGPNGERTFELDGVKMVEIDYMAVDGVLADAGIPADRRQFYVDQLGTAVRMGELARALGERMAFV